MNTSRTIVSRSRPARARSWLAALCAALMALQPATAATTYKFIRAVPGFAGTSPYAPSGPAQSGGDGGNGGGAAHLVFAPSSLSFGTLQPGGSTTLGGTLTNNGGEAATGVVVSTGSPGYSVSSNCPGTLAAAASCNVETTFAPGAAGSYSGSVTAQAAGTTATLALQGSRAPDAQAELDVTGADSGPTADGTTHHYQLGFGAVTLGSSSAVRTVTLTNSGNAALSVQGISAATGASDFAQSNGCGETLAAGASCQVALQFTPAASGARTGTMVVQTAQRLVVLDLTGTAATPMATLSAPDFAPTRVGSSSTAIATLVNPGEGTLGLTVPTTASVTGDGFSFVSTTCGTSLAASASCTVTVGFTPAASGPASGSLAIVTQAGTKTAALGSTGTQGLASISPASLDFASQQVDATSAVQAVTVANTGTDVLTFTGISISGGAADYGQTNDCASVAVGGTCTVNVSFTPSAAGSRPGTLSLVHDGGGVTTIDLAGTGLQALLGFTPGTLAAFVDTATNATADSVLVTLANTGNADATALALTAPTGFSIVNSTCASSLAASSSCSFKVRFAPTAVQSFSGNVTAGATGAAAVTLGVSGTGKTPLVTLPDTTFGQERVGWGIDASNYRTLKLTNSSGGPITVSYVNSSAVSGVDFSFYSTTCNSGSIANGGTCSISVLFNPAPLQPSIQRSGTVTVATSVGTVQAQLTGTAQAGILEFTPAAEVDFGTVKTSSSASRSITVKNVGNMEVTGMYPAFSGPNADRFYRSGYCSSSLSPGQSCTMSVTYYPSAVGLQQAYLYIGDSSSGTYQLSFRGTGTH